MECGRTRFAPWRKQAGFKVVEVSPSIFGKKQPTHVDTVVMLPFYYGLHLGLDVPEDDLYRILKTIEVATVGVTFSLQGRFGARRGPDLAARVVLAAFALVVLFHPDLQITTLACVPVGLFVATWVLRQRRVLRSVQTA